MSRDDAIRAFALENAVKFGGKANPGAIVGKLLGEDPSLKSEVKSLMKDISRIVSGVNKLSLDEQKALLEELDPAVLKNKPVKKEREFFSPLRVTEEEERDFRTAFPPGPEKYPHIGHAKSLLLNRDLAKRYKGRFILRFEDTNPKLAKAEFYDIMRDDFEWLGVQWDELVYASDFMDTYYEYAERAIRDGKAYMCTCPAELIRERRRKGVACECRNRPKGHDLVLWKEFENMEEGSAILRMKIDIAHKNTTLRDPTIFRIIDHPHPRTGKKYRIWPNYDWQNAIMDSHLGITVRIRSKEFELRSHLQRHIQEVLGLRRTRTFEIARFNMEGVPSSGRIIREGIEKGELLGWDDPTLTTIAALRRRGFLPRAIHDFVVSTGMTKAEATLTWDDLIVHNRRLLDHQAKRYFLIANPVKISIAGAPAMKIDLRSHPERPELGSRAFKLGSEFFLERKDFDQLKNGELYRLMDAFNFRKEDDRFVFHSEAYEEFKEKGSRIMHWLPASKNLLDVEVMMPDKTKVEGIAEPSVKDIPQGEVVQFERFGFCRLDEKEGLSFWYTHK